MKSTKGLVQVPERNCPELWRRCRDGFTRPSARVGGRGGNSWFSGGFGGYGGFWGEVHRLLSSRRAASEDSAAVTMVQTVEQRVAVHVSNFRVQVEQLLSDASKEFAHTNKRLAVACERTAMQLHELPSNFRVRQAAGQAAARLIIHWYKHQFRSDPQLIGMLSRLAANNVSVGAFDALEVTMKRALQALPAFMQNAYGKQAMNEASGER